MISRQAIMQKALDAIISEVVREKDHYQQNHKVVFRAVEMIQIVMEIGPNSNAAMTKAIEQIVPEVIQNRQHYEPDHPEIFRAVNTILITRLETARDRRAKREQVSASHIIKGDRLRLK
jgi:replicative DNA helicase